MKCFQYFQVKNKDGKIRVHKNVDTLEKLFILKHLTIFNVIKWCKLYGIIGISLKLGPHFKLFWKDWIFILKNIKQNTEYPAPKPSIISEENYNINICPETIRHDKRKYRYNG